jgi:hypothetical protein
MLRWFIMVKVGFINLFLIWSLGAFAQWGAPYSNNWINFSQRYVKIQVAESGLYRVPFSSLPSDFPINNVDNLKLFFKGKEVAIISTSDNSIVFYGIANDGSADSLLYRPMTARINPYSSLFSDKSAYFLTVSDTKGLRAKSQIISTGTPVINLTYHSQEDLKVNSNEYSVSTSTSIYPRLMNSFYEHGVSKTGERIFRDTLLVTSLEFDNLIRSGVNKPKLELMFHGRSYVNRDIMIFVGSSKSNLRKVSSIRIVEFEAGKVEFEIDPSDVAQDGKLYLGFQSNSTSNLERYSLAYSKLTYDQPIQMSGRNTKTFHIRGQKGEVKRLVLPQVSASAVVYEISDVYNPVLITNKAVDFGYEFQTAQVAHLLITSEFKSIAGNQINTVNFTKPVPSAYNFIIITNEEVSEGATKYATYRASAGGGGYLPLVLKIKDIYNQFNYGEASPLAIRRFVDYMLSDGVKGKYVMIIGKATAYFERRPLDLEGDVPTVGYPGSDILLVEGLAGAPKDVPSIPIGRLGAFTNEQVNAYLEKVKEYEQNKTTNLGWRKNVLHLNGGKTVSEINSFKSELQSLSKLVKNGPVGGDVKAFVKQGLGEVEEVNITPEVNNGVGLITYVGHGATTVTDLDFGYVSAANKGYDNKGKYPLLYYNGCGVGNIFTGRYGTNLSSADKMPISLDWVLAKQRGAIAVIANSFESYAGPSIGYLEKLYETVFWDSDGESLSIGEMQQRSISKVLGGGASSFDISNIHQSLLQGDPTLRLIRAGLPDYFASSEGISIFSKNPISTLASADSLRVQVIVSNLGKFVSQQAVKARLQVSLKGGAVRIFPLQLKPISYKDTIFLNIFNYGTDIERFELRVDPENLTQEISKENNVARLEVDWSIAGPANSYSAANFKDIVPPQIKVTFNGAMVKNEGEFEVNPVMSFEVSDDRILVADPSLVDIYIKNCTGDECEFRKLSYDAKMKFETNSDNSFKIIYKPTDIQNGTYVLMIVARDNSANVSKAYNVLFKVSDGKLTTPSTVVSPNPASLYVKFTASMNKDQSMIDAISCLIYDLKGVLRAERKILLSNVSESYEWYQDAVGMPDGLYIYKVTYSSKGIQVGETKGKFVVAR